MTRHLVFLPLLGSACVASPTSPEEVLVTMWVLDPDPTTALKREVRGVAEAGDFAIVSFDVLVMDDQMIERSWVPLTYSATGETWSGSLDNNLLLEWAGREGVDLVGVASTYNDDEGRSEVVSVTVCSATGCGEETPVGDPPVTTGSETVRTGTP